MTKDAALKLALEALISCELSNYGRDWVWPVTAHEQAMKGVKEAITAINEALAQPEQEPVAWTEKVGGIGFKEPMPNPNYKVTATIAPQRKPLTEQEIGAILEGINAFGTRLYTFARAIEAAHGIKE